MKKLLAVVVVAVVGLVAYNLITTGELRLMPLQVMSDEEQAIRDVEERVQRAATELSQAERSAGLSGIDTSAQAGAALAQLRRLEKEIRKLKSRLESEAARERLDQLEMEIRLLTENR